MPADLLSLASEPTKLFRKGAEKYNSIYEKMMVTGCVNLRTCVHSDRAGMMRFLDLCTSVSSAHALTVIHLMFNL